MQVPPVSSAPVAESVCKYAVSGPVNIVNVLGHGKQDHSHAVHLLQVRPTFWKCVQDQRPACWDMLGQWKNQSRASYHVHPCTVMAACRTSAPASGRAYRPDVESWMPSSYHSIHTHTHIQRIYGIYIHAETFLLASSHGSRWPLAGVKDVVGNDHERCCAHSDALRNLRAGTKQRISCRTP